MGRDPKIDPAEGDCLTNGRTDVVVDGLLDGHVLVRRFRAGEDGLLSAARVPLEVFREHAKAAEVLAMGIWPHTIVCQVCGEPTDGDDGRPTVCCGGLHTRRANFEKARDALRAALEAR